MVLMYSWVCVMLMSHVFRWSCKCATSHVMHISLFYQLQETDGGGIKDGIKFFHYLWYKFTSFCMFCSAIFVEFFSWFLILNVHLWYMSCISVIYMHFYPCHICPCMLYFHKQRIVGNWETVKTLFKWWRFSIPKSK